MNSKSYTDELRDGIRNIWKGFLSWMDAHDAASWPAFFVFLGVVTLGMIMNYIAFLPVVGSLPALTVSLLFESAIVAWKFTSNRKRNDAKQNQICVWATWFSVALAILMLVINLFRVGGDNFDTLAYSIVGAAACTQVVAFLLFDNANPDKKMDRDHSQSVRGNTRKERHAKYAITDARSDLTIIRYIATELQTMQREFSDLPTEQLEYILEATRQKLLKEYAFGKANIDDATKGIPDINKDGKIGNGSRVGNSQSLPPPAYDPPMLIPEVEEEEKEPGF